VQLQHPSLGRRVLEIAPQSYASTEAEQASPSISGRHGRDRWIGVGTGNWSRTALCGAVEDSLGFTILRDSNYIRIYDRSSFENNLISGCKLKFAVESAGFRVSKPVHFDAMGITPDGGAFWDVFPAG
jgi:hypothetical protein